MSVPIGEPKFATLVIVIESPVPENSPRLTSEFPDDVRRAY